MSSVSPQGASLMSRHSPQDVRVCWADEVEREEEELRSNSSSNSGSSSPLNPFASDWLVVQQERQYKQTICRLQALPTNLGLY